MKLFKTLFAALALAVASVTLAAPAMAGDPQIDAAISDGVVGERIDGYLGIVKGGDASLTRKVNEINNKRRAVYEQRARSNNTTVAVMAQLTGEKQIAGLPRGAFFMDESGSWKKK